MAEVPTTDVGGFHGPQVCGLVGITYRQLDYWARTGLLQPSVAAARGSGTRRVYSYSDVLELKVIKQLLDAGVSLQSARRAVECLRQDLGADVASSNLVLTGTSSVLARSNGEVVDLLAGGQGVFNIVPLAGVVDELEADIVRLDISAQSRPSGERPAPGGPGRRRVSRPPAAALHRAGVRTIRPAPPPARCASPIPPSGSSPPCSISTRSAGSTSRSSSPCAGTSRARRLGLPPRLLAARARPVHRVDDGRAAPGHPQERQGAAHAGALSRGPGPRRVPARLPGPARGPRA
jgi:DNA-binding transcriptional MerR regulator